MNTHSSIEECTENEEDKKIEPRDRRCKLKEKAIDSLTIPLLKEDLPRNSSLHTHRVRLKETFRTRQIKFVVTDKNSTI
jgi:hypothetical protein